MTLPKIGAFPVLNDTGNEALKELPANRTLIAVKTTTQPAEKAEIIAGLKNLKEVFLHFQPQIQVEFEDDKGMVTTENIRFQKIGDFNITNIQKQSPTLNKLGNKIQNCDEFYRRLMSNRRLQALVNNSENKVHLIQLLRYMLQQLSLPEKKLLSSSSTNQKS